MPISYYQRPVNKGIRGLKDTIQTIRSKQTVEDLKLIERARERQRYTLETVGEHVHLFSQKQIGDKCSCIREDIPKGDCWVCYGTGWVGGYDKYGYNTILVGWHTKNLKMSNIEQDVGIYPLSLKLTHGALDGFIETDWYGMQSPIEFDSYKFQSYRNGDKAWITPYCQFGSENTWSEFTALEDRIKDQTKVKFRFEFKKLKNVRPPLFELLRFRYKWMEDPIIKIEKGKTTKKLELNEQGFNNMMVNVNYVTMPDPKIYTTDFIEFLSDKRRVKITETTSMDPANKPVTVDMSVRIIQIDEIYWQVF
jgi:hypothetical protein